MENEITEQEAYTRVTEPFREFMLAQVREKDLQAVRGPGGRKPAAEARRPSGSTCACSSRPS